MSFTDASDADLAGVVDPVAVAREDLAAVHVFVGAIDDGMLLDELAVVEAEQRRLDGILTHLLVEAEARGVCDREHGLDTARFLARENRACIGTWQTRVERSVLLHRYFPLFAAALDRGRIGWSHAEVLCRAAVPRIRELLSGCEGELLDAAQAFPYRTFRQLVLELCDLFDQDGSAEPRAVEDSELFITPLFNGTWDVRGTLVGDLGAAIAELVAVEAKRVRDRYRNDRERSGGEVEIPRTPALRAVALHEALARGAAARTPRGTVVTDLTLTIQLDTHDGCCDHEGGFPDLDRGVFRTLDGTRLRASQLESRLCDAAWRFLSLDTGGVPLDLGRGERFATPGQRRAARERDGGCVFPGCDRPHHLTDLHHVDDWERGGHTDIGHLASLCRHHHRLTHRAGWTMAATPDQWFHWTTPAGRTIWSQRHGIPRAPAPQVA